MMNSNHQLLIIQFEKSDTELQEGLANTFGESAKPIETHGFDGGFMDIAQLAIPIATATLPFLLKYFAAREVTKRSKRVLLGPKGEITLAGYGESEVAAILDKITSQKR
jgi:hypothetical protein